MTLQSMRGRLDPKISRQEPTLSPWVRSIINFRYFRIPVPAGANTSQNMSSLQLLPLGLHYVTNVQKSFQGLGFWKSASLPLASALHTSQAKHFKIIESIQTAYD